MVLCVRQSSLTYQIFNLNGFANNLLCKLEEYFGCFKMITNSMRIAIRSNVNSILKVSSSIQDSSLIISRAAISVQSSPLASDVSSKLKSLVRKTQTVFQPAVGGSESTQTTVFQPSSGERHIVQDESVFKPSHTGQVHRMSRF